MHVVTSACYLLTIVHYLVRRVSRPLQGCRDGQVCRRNRVKGGTGPYGKEISRPGCPSECLHAFEMTTILIYSAAMSWGLHGAGYKSGHGATYKLQADGRR